MCINNNIHIIHMPGTKFIKGTLNYQNYKKWNKNKLNWIQWKLAKPH